MTNEEPAKRTQAAIEYLDNDEVTMAAEDKLRQYFEAYDTPMEKLRIVSPQLYNEVSAACESLRIAWGEQCATDACQFIFNETIDTVE